MKERFISEPITPVSGTMPPGDMARGVPGFPRQFTWRGRTYILSETLESWRETGPCKSGGGEQYARKHWFRIRTESGEEMKIYFERQPRSKHDAKKRWWLHSLRDREENPEA